MVLKLIKINNFKSIHTLDFVINEVNGSKTYGLLGINESGKSSFLTAISLKDSIDVNYPADYYDDSMPIKIQFNYEFENLNKDDLNELINVGKVPKEIVNKIVKISYSKTIEFANTPMREVSIKEVIAIKPKIFSEYTIKDNIIQKKGKDELEFPSLNLDEYLLEFISELFNRYKHNKVIWKSTSEYLLLDEINLDSFSRNPRAISIPLANSFILAKYNPSDLVNEIGKLTDPIRIDSMESRLSDAVTHHIKKVWPEHKITIKFKINNNHINLLIEDDGVKYKPKKTSQRSDGFKQFISFLLTISIENVNEELKNTLLLIDEPETHLHPPAQINLLNELIKITSNSNNNILFFATHSNYLIDKENVDRNYKVTKENNTITKINIIDKKKSTYAEINFEIFGILNNDYHNQLYGFVESEDASQLNSLPKTREWKNIKKSSKKMVSLSEYIRHSIHHPENTTNKKFTENELKESIFILREIKDKLL